MWMVATLGKKEKWWAGKSDGQIESDVVDKKKRPDTSSETIDVVDCPVQMLRLMLQPISICC